MTIIYGALIWAAHFMTLYGFTALACARGYASAQWLGISAVAWTGTVATALALAALAPIALPALRDARRGGSNGWLAVGVAALAALGIVWEALPTWIAPACA